MPAAPSRPATGPASPIAPTSGPPKRAAPADPSPPAQYRPCDSVAIPAAQPTQPIPALNLMCNNLHGTGRGGGSSDTAYEKAQHQLHADIARRAKARPDAPASLATNAPRDLESRYRETAARTEKLAYLLTRLRRDERMNAPAAIDVAFFQEVSTSAHPATILEAHYREYRIFAASPSSANGSSHTTAAPASKAQKRMAALYDTAILVHTRLGKANLEADVSCPRATFVTVPSRGLLLVSIHGPFTRVVAFHDDVIAAIERFVAQGWTPIIGGDFNIAPFPGDRIRASAHRAHESAYPNVIPGYERLLDVRDYVHLTAPPAPPHKPYSLANPRVNLFTHKENNGVNVPPGTFTARLDLFLIPLSLLGRPGILYDAYDQGAYSDHKELWMSLPVADAGKQAQRQRRPFVIPHNLCSNGKLQETFNTILEKYAEHGMFDKPPSTAHFTFYAALLDEARAAARQLNKRSQRNLRAEILRLHMQHARLFNENGGRNRAQHRDELEILSQTALELAEKAGVDTQRKAAAQWIRNGNTGSRWQAMVAKEALAPRSTQYIECLRAHLPGEDSASAPIASSSADLVAAAHSYYSNMYKAADPVRPRLDSLLANHKAYADSRGDRNAAPAVGESSARPFTQDEIDDMVKRAGRRKSCGPNGVPAEFYIHSPAARRILCHLGNIWLKAPHLVPQDFANGSIVILFKNKGNPESLDNYRPISLLNADLKILTSTLSARIARLVAPKISPEQFAIIPGKYIHDALYKIQAAVRYLDSEPQEAAIVFLDQAKAYDRIAHAALFAVLENFQVPPAYITAIRRLYAISRSSIIVNGASTDYFPIERGVRQGDALSCVLFVIAGELLGCAIRKHITPAVRAPIPMANGSHMLYMDDTAVFLRSLDDWPTLQHALDWYCDATTAKFNESKTEIISFSRPAERGPIPACVPVVPLPEGDTLRYLGIRLGTQVKARTTTEERNGQIDNIVAAAYKSLRGQHTSAARSYILTTFIIPRFQLLFRFETFTMAQLNSAEKRIRRALWGKRHGYLAHPQSALPRNDGGLGLPSLLAVYRATRLKQVATLALYNARRVQPPLPATRPIPVPDWVPLLHHLWLKGVVRRKHRSMPKALPGVHHLHLYLFDPFSQTIDWAALPSDAWPPAWADAVRMCSDSRQPMAVDFVHTLAAGSSLMRPALGTANSIVHALTVRSTEYNLLFNTMADIRRGTQFGYTPPFTIYSLLNVASVIESSVHSMQDAATRNRKLAFCQVLRDFVAKHCPAPDALLPAQLARPAPLNWAYGVRPTAPPPDAVTRYFFADPVSLDPSDPAPTPEATTRYDAFVASCSDPLEPLELEPLEPAAAESPAAEPPAPPATTPPTPAALPPIPLALWEHHGAVRRALDSAPPIKFPAISLTGAGFSLPKAVVERRPWKMINRLHATPQSRHMLHRLALDRIPRRQGNDERNCHCGAEETVAHLTGECGDFAPFRQYFFNTWLALAQDIVPTVLNELQAAADAAIVAAAREAEAADTAAASAIAAGLPLPPAPMAPVALSAKRVVLPALPSAPPTISNWVVLPLIRWDAFADHTSTSARHFSQLFQLAAATLIHTQWVARSDIAYSHLRWTRHRFAVAYNRRLQADAAATIPAGSPIRRFIDSIMLRLPNQAQASRSRDRTPDQGQAALPAARTTQPSTGKIHMLPHARRIVLFPP